MNFHRWLSLFLLSLILITDQGTKWWAHTALYQPMPCFSFWGVDCHFLYVTNRGAAWGLLSQLPLLLFIIRGAILALLGWALLLGKHPPLYRYPLYAILAGASSNYMDTLFRGAVIDFIACDLWGYPFPCFNCADMAIVIGSGLCLILPKERVKKKESFSLG